MASVNGMAALQERFRRLPDAVKAAVWREMEVIAGEMVAWMRRIAPRDNGELASSIGWTWGAAPGGSVAVTSIGATGRTLTIYAGNEQTIVTNSHGGRFQNARIQEFGARRREANPYFYPVVRAYRRRINRRLTMAAVKAARASWGQ